jgi:hypothetical protein
MLIEINSYNPHYLNNLLTFSMAHKIARSDTPGTALQLCRFRLCDSVAPNKHTHNRPENEIMAARATTVQMPLGFLEA